MEQQVKRFYDPYPLDSHKMPKSRVELHLHLEGSVRLKTICELAQLKKLSITSNNTLEEITSALTVNVPSNLAYFLSKIDIYFPLLMGDLKVIERIAYELAEDQHKQHVIYFEARYTPHGLSNTVKNFSNAQPVPLSDPRAVSPRDVILAVHRGFVRAEEEFGIKARSILCSIKGQADWCTQVLDLAIELRDVGGVVGIDIAGDESIYSDEERDTYKRAKDLGIHRTVHAGETGPASNVEYAVKSMFTERIGHGYHVLQDEAIYKRCLAQGIHFETCPHSSYLTGAVPPGKKHPIVRFAEDNANFSINKDDSTVTQTTLDDEYRLLMQKGLNEVHFIRANLNAARSCFLPDHEKQALLTQLYQVYGVI